MRIDEVIQYKPEYINPDYLFKCIFILGSPGAGKSTLADKVLGIPFDFRIADLDIAMAALKFKEYSKENTSYAWNKLEQRTSLWIDRGLPMSIVTTGKDLARTFAQAEKMQGYGYDVFGVYVLTELQTAIDRTKYREQNAKAMKDRGRQTDEAYTEMVYDILSRSRNDFSRLFKRHMDGFAMTVNTPWIDPFNRANQEATEEIQKFVNRPVQNPIGREKLGL